MVILMVKITFMGAGSTVFAKNVLGDCLCSPALNEAEIALYDIDAERLKDSEMMLSTINHNSNNDRATIKSYLGVENRKEALRNANFVVNAIQVGLYDPCTIIDHCRHCGHRRHHACVAYHSGTRRLCQRYARGLPGCMVLKLYQSYGDAVRIYATLRRYKNHRTLSQCSVLL